MASNPLYTRLTSSARRLSARTALAVGLVGSAVSLALALWFSQSNWKAAPLDSFLKIGLLMLFVQVIIMFVFAPFAARFVLQDTATEAYQLLTLTPLSNAKIVAGY